MLYRIQPFLNGKKYLPYILGLWSYPEPYTIFSSRTHPSMIQNMDQTSPFWVFSHDKSLSLLVLVYLLLNPAYIFSIWLLNVKRRSKYSGKSITTENLRKSNMQLDFWKRMIRFLNISIHFFLIWGLHDFNLSVILLLCCLRALRHALLERFSSALYRTAYKLLIGLFLDV